MTGDVAEFVRGLPKAELHLHIEGTLEPDMMFALAERNGIALPYPDVAAVRDAYAFTHLQSFLDIYYQGAAMLRTRRDFHDLMAAYLARAHGDGVRRAEIFFDPQTHTARGIGIDVFMPGFLDAMEEAGADLGISSALIMCFLRHLPPEDALATFEAAVPYHDRLLGVGLDSSEVGYPPDLFAEVYRRARAVGLHAVAHAGEEGPPSYVTGALDRLGAERIDHGVRCEEDDRLVERLVAARIPLTMCPLSNVALRVVDHLAEHNLARLMARGVRVTINSDDPAYFGGYVADNYTAVAAALDLDRSALVRLARTSLEATFAADTDKVRWLAELDVYASAHD
jgi:adenosine deaminase